jgi:ribose transport system permease protein
VTPATTTWATSVLQRQTASILALALFAIFAATTGGLFLSAGNLENVARQIALDAPLALGETIVLIAGGIDISVGSTMAMAAALAIGLQPYGTLSAVLAALLFGAAVGAVNGLLVTKGRIVPFVATLGTMSLVRGILLTYTRQQPLSGTDDAFTFVGGGSFGAVPVPLLVVAVLLGLGWLFLERTRAGRDLFSIGGNKEAAFLAGVRVERGLLTAFILSGTLAAVAGVLVASRLNSASVQLGNDSPLLAISAALIGGASLLGGRGRLAMAFIGVAALGILANGMNLLGVPTYHQIAIRALILVAIVGADALATNLARRGATASRIAN